MKLQIALDCLDIDTAMGILERVHPWVDIVEAGTELIIAEGVAALRAIKSVYPDLPLLADTKVMDAGASGAALVLDNGADIVSVLGLTDDATIVGALETARTRQKSVLVDMIGVPDVATRAREVDRLGADYICVHNPSSVVDKSARSVDELRLVQGVVQSARIVVTGGVRLAAISELVDLAPDVVVVGSGIVGAADQAAATKALFEAVHRV